jgi:hypothetical protein
MESQLRESCVVRCAVSILQIAYHLVGPFGGYGGYTQQKAGVHSYEVDASVEGKAAAEMKLIVYAPGCEMETYVVVLTDDAKVNREFECARVILGRQGIKAASVMAFPR